MDAAIWDVTVFTKNRERLVEGPGEMPQRDARLDQRSDVRLYREGLGQAAKLTYIGHVIMENRHGLTVDRRLTVATGTAEREAALAMKPRRGGQSPHHGRRQQGLRCRRLRRSLARA
jgi:hypothetical protein